jgi:hypothetical protein
MISGIDTDILLSSVVQRNLGADTISASCYLEAFMNRCRQQEEE